MDKQTIERIRMFDSFTQNNKNTIRFDSDSGMKHRKMVNKICMEIMESGELFFSRARLKDYSLCADIYNITTNTVIEVQESESDENIERKRKEWLANGFKNFEVIKLS
jgi:hypothetical protein